jgi:hypothetical protein
MQPAAMEVRAQGRAPTWLIAATAALALGILAMALAETNLWMHYLIDAGESISLIGLGFILVAGLYLYSRGTLAVSLPMTLPWLLFPVITQGDQLIDNLSINWMRVIVHLLLAAIFGIPVAVVVMAARYACASGANRTPKRWMAVLPGLTQMASGRVREGSAVLAAVLFAVEAWVAVRFLGELMVLTLVFMTWAVLMVGFWPPKAGPAGSAPVELPRRRSERFALAVLVAGVVLSLGLFVGYKNRPGAYQGSPSYFMDPNQKGAGFQLSAVPVPARAATSPSDPEPVRAALTGYARAFERLIGGYYILDRNYNYDFHNHLFWRSTPLLANYRAAGLEKVREAERLRASADAAAQRARPTLGPDDPLGALLDDMRSYAAFTFSRAPVLERMTGEFARTDAGLQHATHMYEGEGKVLGVRLAEILDKHRAVLASQAVRPVTSDFLTVSRSVHDLYANRIVGF